MAIAEKLAGLDSFLSYTNEPACEVVPQDSNQMAVVPMDKAKDADVHVVHSHLPDGVKGKTVFVAHGTPEHCFNMAVEQSKQSGYVAGDPWMLSKYRVDTCDVTVTFWPRHAYIWQSINPKADVRVIPMGVDTDFWKPTPSQGKWAGEPSLFTCENSHQIKWPLDLILAYPLVMKAVEKAVLHIHYLPMDQHRWWFPLIQANGTCYKSFSSGLYFDQPTLRNAFCSVNYYINPVRYGDFNTICLEAKASGCKVISYRGNPYADFWLTEGDQRVMAQELTDIISGKIPARETQPVANVTTMAQEMIKIYESLSSTSVYAITGAIASAKENLETFASTISANVEMFKEDVKKYEEAVDTAISGVEKVD